MGITVVAAYHEIGDITQNAVVISRNIIDPGSFCLF